MNTDFVKNNFVAINIAQWGAACILFIISSYFYSYIGKKYKPFLGKYEVEQGLNSDEKLGELIISGQFNKEGLRSHTVQINMLKFPAIFSKALFFIVAGIALIMDVFGIIIYIIM